VRRDGDTSINSLVFGPHVAAASGGTLEQIRLMKDGGASTGTMGQSGMVKLETMSRTSLYCMALGFFVALAGFVVGGVKYGPHEFREKLISQRELHKEDEFKWYVAIRSMTEKHRDLAVEVEFKAKHVKKHFTALKKILARMGPIGMAQYNRTYIIADDKFSVGAFIDAYGLDQADAKLRTREHTIGDVLLKDEPTTLHINCPGHQEWCDPATVLDFETVHYAGYNVDCRFESHLFGGEVTSARFYMKYGNQIETTYLILFKYLFVALSGLVCIWYTLALGNLEESEQSVEQQWLFWLVFLLMFFNDPLYLAEIQFGWVSLAVLSVIFHCTFISALLLFWLILLDHIRLSGKAQRIEKKSFYPAKALFIFVFWLLSILVMSFNIEERSENPAWKTQYDMGAFVFFKMCALAALVFYVGWIFMMVVLLFSEIRSLNYRFQFLLLFSLLVSITAVVGVVLGFHNMAHPNMGEWTGFYSIFNMYVYMLAYLYSPSSASEANKFQSLEMSNLGGDDFDDGDDDVLEMDTSDFAPQFHIDDFDDEVQDFDSIEAA
jgi:hypothetical protein